MYESHELPAVCYPPTWHQSFLVICAIIGIGCGVGRAGKTGSVFAVALMMLSGQRTAWRCPHWAGQWEGRPPMVALNLGSQWRSMGEGARGDLHRSRVTPYKARMSSGLFSSKARTFQNALRCIWLFCFLFSWDPPGYPKVKLFFFIS